MPTSHDLNRELDAMADDVLKGETATSASTASNDRRGLGVRVSQALPPSTSTMSPSTSASSFHQHAFHDDDGFPAHDRNVATLVHLGSMCATLFSGGLFLPVLVPLIARMAIKNGGVALHEHIRQQLNFQLTLAIFAVIGVAGTVMTLGMGIFVFVPLLLFMLAVEVYGSVKGALAATNGELYDFPFSLNLVKRGDDRWSLPPTR
jgi:uncharacterized Tic20 family protein